GRLFIASSAAPISSRVGKQFNPRQGPTQRLGNGFGVYRIARENGVDDEDGEYDPRRRPNELVFRDPWKLVCRATQELQIFLHERTECHQKNLHNVVQCTFYDKT